VSQPSRSQRGRPAPRQSPVPAIISALIVVLVFVALGFVLANNRPGGEQTAAAPTEPSFADQIPTAPTEPGAEGAPTTAPVTAKTYDAPPPMTIDASKNYTATITTPRGNIVIKLRPDLAPETVNSFVFLAREGFYDGLTWHRVLPGFVAQGGDPFGTGTGDPGYSIPDEYTSEVLFDKPGIVAMASSGPGTNSGGSQFFITLAPTESLNEQYTIFGEVVEGLDIVQGIPPRDPDQNPTTPGEQMLSITIEEG
jgi:peptidylprolyl isomerase